MDSDFLKKNVLIGFFFSIVVLIATLLFSGFLKNFGLDKTTVFWLNRFSFWLCLVLIYVFVNQVEKQNFLLWNETELSFVEYLKSFVSIFIKVIIGALVIGLTLKFLGNNPKQGSKFIEILKLLKSNFPLLIFTCLTAGITEEFIFRGYLMPRLQFFFSNSLVPITISSVLFGLMHIGYGTIMQIIGPMFIGFVLAFHYQKFRNIKILIVFHFFWDFISIMAYTQNSQHY